MDNAESVLVVILAAFLALALLLTVLVLVKCLQIVRQVHRITSKAEDIVEKAESISDFFTSAKSSYTVGRLISHIANSVFNHNAKDSEEKRK